MKKQWLSILLCNSSRRKGWRLYGHNIIILSDWHVITNLNSSRTCIVLRLEVRSAILETMSLRWSGCSILLNMISKFLLCKSNIKATTAEHGSLKNQINGKWKSVQMAGFLMPSLENTSIPTRDLQTCLSKKIFSCPKSSQWVPFTYYFYYERRAIPKRSTATRRLLLKSSQWVPFTYERRANSKRSSTTRRHSNNMECKSFSSPPVHKNPSTPSKKSAASENALICPGSNMMEAKFFFQVRMQGSSTCSVILRFSASNW